MSNSPCSELLVRSRKVLGRLLVLLLLSVTAGGCTTVAITTDSHADTPPTHDFKPLDALMKQGVADSVFPGATIAVRYHDKILYHKGFGRLTYDKQSEPVDTTILYDLASLTKAVATTSIIMQLVDHDSLSIHDPVAKYLPAFAAHGKEKVTIEHLLRHTSGLRAHTLFSKTCSTPDAVYATITADSLLFAPGSATLYSDLGFITLGRIIATITGKGLDVNFRERFSKPLGMQTTMFTPPATIRERIAPVEADANWPLQTPRPLVHDQNAALLGGIAGHAGLFSSTGDLLRFTRMLMHGGISDSSRLVKQETVAAFTARTDAERALGWDLRSLHGPSSSGTYFSTRSYGHLGYTGTSIWIDPDNDLEVILLTNRVYPDSKNIRIRKFRPLIHDTVVQCIGIQPKRESLP